MFLLGHGLIKLALVIALLRRWRWAFPVAIALLGAFFVYQVYRVMHTRSLALIGLTATDLVVIALIWTEYRREWPRR